MTTQVDRDSLTECLPAACAEPAVCPPLAPYRKLSLLFVTGSIDGGQQDRDRLSVTAAD